MATRWCPNCRNSAPSIESTIPQYSPALNNHPPAPCLTILIYNLRNRDKCCKLLWRHIWDFWKPKYCPSDLDAGWVEGRRASACGWGNQHNLRSLSGAWEEHKSRVQLRERGPAITQGSWQGWSPPFYWSGFDHCRRSSTINYWFLTNVILGNCWCTWHPEWWDTRLQCMLHSYIRILQTWDRARTCYLDQYSISCQPKVDAQNNQYCIWWQVLMWWDTCTLDAQAWASSNFSNL